MDAAPARALAWWHGRPRRSGAQRRAQKERAHARTIQHLLAAFAEVQSHRGGQLTVLGEALLQALQPASAAGTEAATTSAAAAAPPFPPGVWEPIDYVMGARNEPHVYTKEVVLVPVRATSPRLPLVCIELQTILGPEIFAAQAAGIESLDIKYKARLCHHIDIIDLAFAHNI